MTTFTTIEQIEAAETKDLIAFYNSVNPSKPVKKFADRATALKRCSALLDLDGEKPDAQAEAPEAEQEFDEDGIPVGELKPEEKKFHWPFETQAETLARQAAEASGEGATDGAKTKGAKPKAEKIKKSISHASNAAGVAASWGDKEVAEARLKRDGVSVTFKGNTTTHKSTRDAFRHYRLLDSKHIRFRGILKAAQSATYTENGLDYLFNII